MDIEYIAQGHGYEEETVPMDVESNVVLHVREVTGVTIPVASTSTISTTGRFIQPYVNQIPLNPLKVMYFWLYAFPTIFMPSYTLDTSGNVTESDSPSDFVCKQTRKYRPTFIQWLEWISNNDFRFMSHGTFAFVALNLKNKITATSSVSYGVSTMGEQGALKKHEIAELVKESLTSGKSILPQLTMQLTSWCRNVTENLGSNRCDKPVLWT